MAGMGGTSAGGGGSGPKILLAKPAVPRAEGAGGGSGAAGMVKLMRDRDDDSAARARLPHGSLNLLSDSWEFFPDRLLPLMSDNTDFTVVGVLGAPGVGKSTIMNELYGFDGTSSGVLPPFSLQSEETRAAARHCSVGIELRMSVERFILLDTQPVFSSSMLADLMRPDGSSAISVVGGDSMSAELALELMGLQLGVFLCSVCHVVLLVTEGLHDISLWRLMQTVEMLKQGIPDPSITALAGSHPQAPLTSTVEKDDDDSLQDEQPDFFADAVFVHTKLHESECTWSEIWRLQSALSLFFPTPEFRKNSAVHCLPQFQAHNQGRSAIGGPPERGTSHCEEGVISLGKSTPADKVDTENGPSSTDNGGFQGKEDGGGLRSFDDSTFVNFFVLPAKASNELSKKQHESYSSLLKQLRDQVLAMPRRPFAKPMSERDWLRSAFRTWDLVKKSPVLADYSKMLQGSGLYRR